MQGKAFPFIAMNLEDEVHLELCNTYKWGKYNWGVMYDWGSYMQFKDHLHKMFVEW